jgi:hypothetical protein
MIKILIDRLGKTVFPRTLIYLSVYAAKLKGKIEEKFIKHKS